MMTQLARTLVMVLEVALVVGVALAVWMFPALNTTLSIMVCDAKARMRRWANRTVEGEANATD